MKTMTQIQKFLKSEIQKSDYAEDQDALENILSYSHGVSVNGLWIALRPEGEETERDIQILRNVRNFIDN